MNYLAVTVTEMAAGSLLSNVMIRLYEDDTIRLAAYALTLKIPSVLFNAEGAKLLNDTTPAV
jgi:hypothetical protein